EALLVVRPLNAERALVEMLAGADPEDHAPGMERTQRAESLRDDRGVIAKRRRHHRRAEDDSAGALAGSGQPCEREWRVSVGVAPGLEMVADEHRVEPVRLGRDGEVEELARAELLGRSLVPELQLGAQSAAPSIALPAERDAADCGSDDDHHERDE